MDNQFTLPSRPEQKYEEPDLSDLKPGIKRTMTTDQEYAAILEICKRDFDRNNNRVETFRGKFICTGYFVLWQLNGWNIAFNHHENPHRAKADLHSLSFETLVTLLEKYI